MVSDEQKALWEKYYMLTVEMKKFLDREDIDEFLEIAAQRDVIFKRMWEGDDSSLRDTPEYKAFAEKLQPVYKEVMMRAQSWLARSRRRNANVRAYAKTGGFQSSGHMLNTKS